MRCFIKTCRSIERDSMATQSLEGLISALGLSQWYPGKLTVEEAIAIGPRKNDRGGRQLIRDLIGCNAKARDEVAINQDLGSDVSEPARNMNHLQEQDDDSNDDDDWNNDDDGPNNSGMVNQMDVMYACFVCCNEDLKQLLSQRLFFCKLAFPFVYHDESNQLVTNLKNLRSITIEYKDKQGKVVEMPVFSDREVSSIAFLRIGTHDLSKSNLLNCILNDGKHETFVNRESKNGSVRRIYSSGLVEAAIYISPEAAIDPFVALNLRGDVTDNLDLARLLYKCASVLVCLIAVEDILNSTSQLTYLAAQSNRLIIILTKRSPNTKTNKTVRTTLAEKMKEAWSRTKIVLGFKGKDSKSCKEIKDEVLKALKENIGDSRTLTTQLQLTGLFVEENDARNSGQSADELASRVVRHYLECEAKTEFKNRFLPLHMHAWKEYSKLYKDTFSSKAQNSNVSRLQERMLEIRNNQVDSCREFSPIVKDLFRGLTRQAEEVTNGIILLEDIRQKLYQISIEVVPPLQKSFLKAKKELGACIDEAEAETLKATLTEAEERLVNASLDLNSLFRETAQIYEASQESSTQFPTQLKDEVANLPDIFAKLLLHGVPLEILDGDSSNIPIIWVSAVLRACHNLVGEKKLFIISVLGVQSSGKSTLLNTMFGLRFPVSAGRCTRGAYLQIVKVTPDSGLPFDYVAILDTEGLRAPELGSASPRHDNELATLVIGLGDVSIVNVKGENSSDMKEILPIAVNAFLRMRQVNKKLEIHHSCVFIHQNVSAVSAKEKMEEATIVMKKELDDYTREAAAEEGIADIHSFDEIIAFDCDEDIFFLPDLWFGDPPVASVNPGYAEKVQEIREHLIFKLSQRQKTFSNFIDFTIRIGDLWKAIMSEDFVFSFRNSIEMKAYLQMELALIECKDKIDDFGNDWLHKTAFVRIKLTSSEEQIISEIHSLQKEMSQTMSTVLTSTKEQLEKYFEEDSYKEYSAQWKQGAVLSLDRACSSKQEELRDRMKEKERIRLVEVKQDTRLKEWEKTALQKARDLALKMTGSEIPEETIKKCFETLWETIISELPSEQPHSMVPINEQIENLLRKFFHKDNSILEFCLQQTPLSQHLSMSDVECFLSDCLSEIQYRTGAAHGAEIKCLNPGERALSSIKPMLAEISEKENGFFVADARKILSEASRVLRDERHQLESHGIGISSAFEIKVSIGALRLALPTFYKVEKDYTERHNIKSRLEALKEKIWNFFVNRVACKKGEKISADFVRDHVAGLIRAVVVERMSDKLKVHIRNQIGKHKYYLIVMMLTEWADSDDFQSVISYIDDSKAAALKWLSDFSDRFLFTQNDTSRTPFTEIVEADVAASIFKTVYDSCEQACESVNRKEEKNLKQWSAEFCQCMSRELAVKPEDFTEIFMYPIGDSADFLECLKDGFRVKAHELTDWLSTMNGNSEKWPGRNALYSSALDSLWGCDAQCPFCAEPCSDASSKHHETYDTAHKCIQHRPQCAAGVRLEGSEQAVSDTCSFSVSTQHRFCCTFCKTHSTDECNRLRPNKVYHPYQRYKKFFPHWDIAPDSSNTSSKYWMWFVWTFREKLKDKCNYKIDEIPSAWAAITKDAAKQSLRELLN